MTVGIPIKLLHESQGLTVSVELKTGQIYRGRMQSVEDSMNLQLKDVTVIGRDGQVTQTEQCFIRGSSVRMITVPDSLRYAPFFKTMMEMASKATKGTSGKPTRPRKTANTKPKSM